VSSSPPTRDRGEDAAATLHHFARWFAWQAKFIWQAVMQREFEDDRVQQLVRQHFKEFHRGT
jgi:hypothetical protein